MVLSDGEDRDTLFAGLRTLIKIFDNRGGLNDRTREEEEDNMEEEVEGMRSDDASGELASEMEGKEEPEEDFLEEEEHDKSEEESSPKTLHEDELVRELNKDELLNNDKEPIRDDQRLAPDYDDSYHKRLVVDERAPEVDVVSHHSTNESDTEEQLVGSSPSIISWAHGTMADDQELSEEEGNSTKRNLNHESKVEHDGEITD